jgi:RNA polymerase sigma-70 factor, ECF subfamily
VETGRPPETDERALAQRFCLGDKDAFLQLMKIHQRAIYITAFSYLRNGEDSQDVVQETFMRAWTARERFEADRPLFPWLHRICRNLCLSEFRCRKSRPMTQSLSVNEDNPYDPPSNTIAPDEKAQEKEMEEIIWDAIGALSNDHREVIILRDKENLSYKDISARLDIPIGTVMSRLFLAREKLRDALEPYLKN